MNAASSPSEDPGPALPWRKRHPVISRTLLYGLGLSLAVVLAVLFTERKDEDRAAGLVARQVELDGLGLVLATDPSGAGVREILDTKYADPTLPVFLRGRALRWRAMAWRAHANTAAARGDDAACADGFGRADAAFEACRALDLEPAERAAMQLEWAEARLERRELKQAVALLPAPSDLASVPQALIRALLLAQAHRLEGQPERGLEVVRAALGGVEAPLDTETKTYLGGREWTAAEAAVELASFATTVGEHPSDAALWQRLRRAAPDDYALQAAAARGLEQLGLPDDAAAAWRAARRLQPALATAEARRDSVLGQVEARLVRD